MEKVTQKDGLKSSLVECKCGCGQEIEEYNKWGRKREFVQGHHLKLHPTWLGKHISKEHNKKLQKGREKLKGEKHPFYGVPKSEEVKLKISQTLLGNVPWNKGRKIGNPERQKLLKNGEYRNLHYWVERRLGRASYCTFNKVHKGKFEWANKSWKYRKELDDWISLCRKCHRKYDEKYYKK